jgi:hypothetical protein
MESADKKHSGSDHSAKASVQASTRSNAITVIMPLRRHQHGYPNTNVIVTMPLCRQLNLGISQ